ncbi:MAG: hypothetical protein JSS72_06250 [Armatimonadetes bacterium]|nr:hypothetical protein [Armatimonadota bacterium]
MEVKTPVRPHGTLVALILAVVTVGVFWSLRNYGPESAIREFHEAILLNDPREFEHVCLDVQSPATQVLALRVSSLIRRGATYRLIRVDRSPRKVFADAQYVLPNGFRVQLIFVVQKDLHQWKINTDESERIVRESFGMEP